MSVLNDILNEDKKRFGSNAAPQLPWSVQLCITYGCNRAPLARNRYVKEDGTIDCKNGCVFCGAASLIDPETDTIHYSHMTVDTAKEIARQLNDWVPSRRIEINNFGEPWMNPNWVDIVRALREGYPSASIQLQTNGLGTYKQGYDKFKEKVDAFFEAGGNLLAIDAYEGSYPTYMEFARQYTEETGVQSIDFMHDNPDNMTYYRRANPKTRELYVVDDLGECDQKTTQGDKKAQRNVNNHAGCMIREAWSQYGIPTEGYPIEKKCSRVFREIIIGWDGCVTLCCNDFLRRLNFGDIHDKDIREIWNSEEWNTVRKFLYDKDRSFCSSCYECSYGGGFRLGFLDRPEGDITDEEVEHLYELESRYDKLVNKNAGECWIKYDGKSFSYSNPEVKVLAN